MKCNKGKVFYGIGKLLEEYFWDLWRIENPITSLQKNEDKFFWTKKCEDNFKLLKELLTYAAIVNIVEPNREYGVGTNASLEGFGGVLMQEGHVIFYESQNLKEHEKSNKITWK